MICRLFTIFFMLLVALTTTDSRAQVTLDTSMPIPRDVSKVDFSLLTVDIGNAIWARGGHTMLRVHDRDAQTDWAFNWGLFDFAAPGFVFKFLEGIQIYKLGIWNAKATMNLYRMAEKRGIWEDQIHLTDKQKTKLLNALASWSAPEHRSYRYRLWYENCSTRIRDLLNDATDGGLRSSVASVAATESYRSHARWQSSGYPPLDAVTDIMLAGLVDDPVTGWDEMYLPHHLRRVLQTSAAIGDDHHVIPGSNLLSDPTRVVDMPPPWDPPMNGYLALLLIIGVPGMIGIFLSRRKRQTSSLSTSVLSAIPVALWATLSSVMSIVMILAWMFSDHTELHRNVNLLLFWPCDIMFLAWAWQQVCGRTSNFVLRFTQNLIFAHGIGMIVHAVLYFAISNPQKTASVMAWMYPINIVVFTLVLGTARRRTAVNGIPYIAVPYNYRHNIAPATNARYSRPDKRHVNGD